MGMILQGHIPPAAAQAVKSLTAAGSDVGPSFGMNPPNQVRSDEELLVSGGFADPVICPLPFSQLHVPDAVAAPSKA